MRVKQRQIAVLLAIASALSPISGFHKFYLGQLQWGILYVLLSWTLIPKVASALEGIWYVYQSQDEFDWNFNSLNGVRIASLKQPPVDSAQVESVAAALRQMDILRQDGLISEYEFEQKRRQLLDRIG